MITVEEAERIIQSQVKDYGAEILPLELSPGRILAENLKADRDMPPFNRVTMDGIAVSYKSLESGISSFHIKAIQAAGDNPVEIQRENECIEIMTGAMLPQSADTVIRYEDLNLSNGVATILTKDIKRGQNIHYQGKDKKAGERLASVGAFITPALIGVVASIGESELRVKKLPKVVIISSGDELVKIEQVPLPSQIRRSNNYMIKGVLQQSLINADMLHVPDNQNIISDKLKYCIENYDVILLSGGVSMGKFDFIPQALEKLKVEKLFHKVQQRPGKPFWFGKHDNGTLIFAFPGNPVSTFLCVYRYFIPWLNASIGNVSNTINAVLSHDINFQFPLKYFMQVKLSYDENCRLIADPAEGNGSGDFSNLSDANAFMELPPEKNRFEKGEIFKVWRF